MIKKYQSTDPVIGPGIAVQWYRVLEAYLKRPLGLILLVLMILMGFEVGTKKPLCINSQIVNKIDRVSFQNGASANGKNIEIIYSCASYRIPAFSSYFYENSMTLHERFLKIEKVASLLNLRGRLDIEINETTPGQLKLKNSTISVSPERLDDPEFAKLFVSVLLLENMKFESGQFVDFLAGWLTGNSNSESALEEIWNDSYENLSRLQKFAFKEEIYSELRKAPAFQSKSMTENMLALLSSSQSSVQVFKNIFTQKLSNLGLGDSSKPLDVVFEIQSPGEFNLDALVALAKNNKNKRVAFQDQTGLYLLPYKTKVDDSLKNQLRSTLRVLLVSKTTPVNFDRYFKNTERLILFKERAAKSELKVSMLFATNDLAKNELSLLHANKNFDVIQFHVPSMRFRQAQLKQIKDYFGLIKEAKSSSALQKKKLGWESVVWSSEAQAFKPIAVYDVVQFYRLN